MDKVAVGWELFGFYIGFSLCNWRTPLWRRLALYPNTKCTCVHMVLFHIWVMEFYVGYSTEIPPPTSLISGWNSVDLGFTFPPPHSALSPPEAVGKEGRTRFFFWRRETQLAFLKSLTSISWHRFWRNLKFGILGVAFKVNPFKVDYNFPGSEIGENKQINQRRPGLNPISPTHQRHNSPQVTLYILTSIPEFAKQSKIYTKVKTMSWSHSSKESLC